jgi:hypothetical protein
VSHAGRIANYFWCEKTSQCQIKTLGRVTKQVFVTFDGNGVRRDVLGIHDVLGFGFVSGFW